MSKKRKPFFWYCFCNQKKYNLYLLRYEKDCSVIGKCAALHGWYGPNRREKGL